MMMTPQEFAAEMSLISIKDGWDIERMHMEADELLITLLRQMGYTEGCDIYEKMERWCA